MSPLDRYTCEEAFRRVNDFLDRELADAEVARVQAHLETCAACTSEYRFEDSLLRDIKSKLRRIALAPKERERLERRLTAALRAMRD